MRMIDPVLRWDLCSVRSANTNTQGIFKINQIIYRYKMSNVRKKGVMLISSRKESAFEKVYVKIFRMTCRVASLEKTCLSLKAFLYALKASSSIFVAISGSQAAQHSHCDKGGNRQKFERSHSHARWASWAHHQSHEKSWRFGVLGTAWPGTKKSIYH